MTMERAVSETVRDRAFSAWLYGAFAVAALLIVSVGVLGFVAMSTSGRVRELGLRMALGSTRAGVVSLLVREQLAGVTLGLVAGAVTCYWAVEYLRSSLYGFAPHDLRLWSIALGLIATVAMAGALVPALRASRVDPVEALRGD
jgi:ABC-type antimicrobial peptide transport system permease subunit